MLDRNTSSAPEPESELTFLGKMEEKLKENDAHRKERNEKIAAQKAERALEEQDSLFKDLDSRQIRKIKAEIKEHTRKNRRWLE